MNLPLPLEGKPGGASVTFALALRTTNPLNMGGTGNTRLAAIIRTQRRAKERKTAMLGTRAAMREQNASRVNLVPALVTLTRVSAGRMDDDGLAASFKGIRDGIADALGLNDGGRFVRFIYFQRKGPQRAFAIEVSIVRGL